MSEFYYLALRQASEEMENQRQLQQSLEERNNALHDLSTWIDNLKTAKKPVQRPKLSAISPPSSSGGTYDEIHKRGNEYFAKKQYAEALECYTRCLESEESQKNPVMHSNRAMVYLKLKQFANAESDASSALQIYPTHSKSLHRRALARLSLGKLRGALRDILQAAEKDVEVLKSKCQQALVEATIRAPRRNISISVE